MIFLDIYYFANILDKNLVIVINDIQKHESIILFLGFSS